MSIQTELTRIKNAKAAIKTAIEGKGVTVPDATLLDGMAALIESIEAGGGGCAYGTFTLSAAAYYYELTHNLGVTPNFAIFFQSAGYSVNSGTAYAGLFINGEGHVYNEQQNGQVFPAGCKYSIDTTSPVSYPSNCYGVVAYAATPTTIKFGNENKSSYGFGSGVPIIWIVGVIE